MFRLDNQVAVITGGAGLLGRAIASTLAMSGANVFIADSDLAKAKEAAKELNEASNKVTAISLNIANLNSIKRVIKAISHKAGRIDIWINNAYPRTKDWDVPFEKIPARSWKKNIDAHLNGYCFCCQAAAEYMKSQGGGSIINMASIYGIQGPDFSIYENTKMTMPAAYSVIKGGIVNFTRYLASYYGPHGVRVNSISPGGIENEQPINFIKKYSQKTPLRRMGKPDDVAAAVQYLAAPAASYVTGHNLIVDGGWSIT